MSFLIVCRSHVVLPLIQIKTANLHVFGIFSVHIRVCGLIISLARRRPTSAVGKDINAIRRQPQRNDYRFTAGILDSTQIQGQRAMAVFGIVRAGFRNGNPGLHMTSV